MYFLLIYASYLHRFCRLNDLNSLSEKINQSNIWVLNSGKIIGSENYLGSVSNDDKNKISREQNIFSYYKINSQQQKRMTSASLMD